jgi:hypothetical protein
MAGRSSARASSAVSPPSRRPSRSPRCQPATTAAAAACGLIPTLAQVSVGQGAQFHGQVGHEHQLLWLPLGVAGHQFVQQGAVWLGDAGVQQRGRGHHQHPADVLVAGWVQHQAEVAVRHPAELQDLAVGVDAELCHWPAPAAGWVGHQATRPDDGVDLNEPVAQRADGGPMVWQIRP